MTTETSNARGGVRGLVAKWRASVRSAKQYSTTVYEDGYAAAENACADELESALAAEGVQAGEVEQRARELLAAEYQKRGHGRESAEARASYIERHECAAFDAIASALSQQPEARGVGDEEALRAAFTHGWDSCWERIRNPSVSKVDEDWVNYKESLTGERNG